MVLPMIEKPGKNYSGDISDTYFRNECIADNLLLIVEEQFFLLVSRYLQNSRMCSLSKCSKVIAEG